jgi:REP element-mobilizing transposase RayT
MHTDLTTNRRRNMRLPEYDYSRVGSYFVTICAYHKDNLFGNIFDGIMQVNKYGEIIQQEWLRTGELRKNVQLDAFVIMPNHIHGIIFIIDNEETTNGDEHRRGTMHRAPTKNQFGKPVAGSLGTILGTFKAAVTRRINKQRKTPGAMVWQRNYYERIIRNEDELYRTREYIINNPLKWTEDRENPDAVIMSPSSSTAESWII